LLVADLLHPLDILAVATASAGSACGIRVSFFSFVDVDRAAYVSVETRVEETGRILQKRARKFGHETTVPGPDN